MTFYYKSQSQLYGRRLNTAYQARDGPTPEHQDKNPCCCETRQWSSSVYCSPSGSARQKGYFWVCGVGRFCFIPLFNQVECVKGEVLGVVMYFALFSPYLLMLGAAHNCTHALSPALNGSSCVSVVGIRGRPGGFRGRRVPGGRRTSSQSL